jgi:hypothetical protein
MEIKMADSTAKATNRFASEVMDTIASVDRLLATGPSGKISFADLYAYAINPLYEPAKGLLDELDRDTNLQADFQRLLRNTARYHLPEVAAASTGILESREGKGCRIILKSSRADPNHLYVIVEVSTDKTFEPEILFVQFPDGRMRRAPLGISQNGRVQILLERDTEIAEGLLDIATEVYVK